MNKEQTKLRRLAWAVLVLSIMVILGGAFVRASVSGDGCGDEWPTCHGKAIPAFESSETLIEWSHRLSSGLAFLGALALFLCARKWLNKGHPARRAAFLSFVFMCTEALIGAALVVLKLVAHNASLARAVWVSGHLINTFLLLGALSTTIYLLDERRIRFESPGENLPQPRNPRTRWLGYAALLAFIPMGISGAIAALGDALFPASSLSEALALEFSQSAHFLLRLRVLHPLICWVGAATIVAAAVVAWWKHQCWRLSTAALALILAEICVGFANVLLLTPIALQLLHLLLADLLLIATVMLTHILATPSIKSINISTLSSKKMAISGTQST